MRGARMRSLSKTMPLGLGLAFTIVVSFAELSLRESTFRVGQFHGSRETQLERTLIRPHQVSDPGDVRQPASLPFPRHQSSSDKSDILSEYPDYLRFVLEIGKDVDPQTAQFLSKNYQSLRKRDPSNAARFLKGLRFEMVQKLELMGMSPSSVSTATPSVRQWVKRYLKEWNREADEYLFRSIAFRTR